MHEFVVSASSQTPVAEDATILRTEDAKPLAPDHGRQVPRAWVAQSPSKTEFFDRDALLDSAGAVTGEYQAGLVDVPTLLVLSGKDAGARIELKPGARSGAQWLVGSDASSEIVLSDPGVSALHAAIISEGRRWQVVDKMSANGTFVDGKHTPKSYLSPGAHIKFGPVECMLLLPQSGENTVVPARTGGGMGNRAVMIAVISFLATIGAVTAFYFLSR